MLYARKTRKQYSDQYLKTFDKITKVSKYDPKLKQLNIELKFYDLKNETHKKTFNIRYPDF